MIHVGLHVHVYKLSSLLVDLMSYVYNVMI